MTRIDIPALKTAGPRAGLALLLGGLILLTGCGAPDNQAGDVSTPGGGGSAAPAASTIDVITQVEGRLGEMGIGADPGSLICDGELAVAADASVGCEFTADQQPVGLVVSVAKVDGGEATLKVETEARPMPQVILENRVRTRVEREMGSSVEFAACTGDLAAEVGASAGCTLTAAGTTRELEVKVDSIDGGLIGISIGDAA